MWQLLHSLTCSDILTNVIISVIICYHNKRHVLLTWWFSPVPQETHYHASLLVACNVTFSCGTFVTGASDRCSTLLLNELWCFNKRLTAYRELMVLPLSWQILHSFYSQFNVNLLQSCAVSKPACFVCYWQYQNTPQLVLAATLEYTGDLLRVSLVNLLISF